MASSDWYGEIAPKLVNWKTRQQALLSHISSFDSDLICLQEVEPHFFERLRKCLGQQGYIGLYAKKGGAKPDGIAFFYRPSKVKVIDSETFFYTQSSAVGNATHWRPAQIIEFEVAGRRFGIVNTHLAWDSAGETALAELQELLTAKLAPRAKEVERWIICGDFNVVPDSDAIKFLREKGFRYAAEGSEQVTCSLPIQHFAEKVDYIFYSDTKLQATAQHIEEVVQGAYLPSRSQPSDHLAIGAQIIAAEHCCTT